MKQRNWGRIIFISSESAISTPKEMIHYGMTKTAQLAVSRGLAEYCCGTGVTVNSILVAHSYGGAVITEAGTDPSVAGLVYIAAHMPDAGENEADDGKRFPSDLSKSTAIKKTADGFTYLDPAHFHEYFAADLSADQAAFMARSQVL